MPTLTSNNIIPNPSKQEAICTSVGAPSVTGFGGQMAHFRTYTNVTLAPVFVGTSPWGHIPGLHPCLALEGTL